MKKIIRAVLALALCNACAVLAQTAAFPTKPMRLVVPLPPGGSNDLIARHVAQKFGESWGHPVVVENRPGANTIIGTEQVVKSAPDGHTLLIGVTSTWNINPVIYPKLSYEPARDLAPVTMLGNHALIIAVNPAVPANSLRELVALAKAQPGKLNYGTPAVSFHVVVETFSEAAGARFNRVPYKGSVPALAGLLGGDLQFVFIDPPPALPHIRAGKLRALAVTSTRRTSYLPDVPTVAEAGIPGFEAVFWIGLFAPAATPRDVIAKLQQEASRAVLGPEGRERMAALGIDPVGNSPEEFAAYLKAEGARYAPVIRAANIGAE